MKIRVLYPMALAGLVKKEPEAGDIIDVDQGMADALIAEGYAEKPDAKAQVEQATASPGEKRQTRSRKA